jgi:hypothetical protein
VVVRPETLPASLLFGKLGLLFKRQKLTITEPSQELNRSGLFPKDEYFNFCPVREKPSHLLKCNFDIPTPATIKND